MTNRASKWTGPMGISVNSKQCSLGNPALSIAIGLVSTRTYAADRSRTYAKAIRDHLVPREPPTASRLAAQGFQSEAHTIAPAKSMPDSLLKYTCLTHASANARGCRRGQDSEGNSGCRARSYEELSKCRNVRVFSVTNPRGVGTKCAIRMGTTRQREHGSEPRLDGLRRCPVPASETLTEAGGECTIYLSRPLCVDFRRERVFAQANPPNCKPCHPKRATVERSARPCFSRQNYKIPN